MVKCTGCGMNLREIYEKSKEIVGVNLGAKFGVYDEKKLNDELIEMEVDICCRIFIITYIPLEYQHYKI